MKHAATKNCELTERSQRFQRKRRKAEPPVSDSEQRFREMIDALPAAIYTTDAEGRLTYFNAAAVQFSGRVPELGTDQWCVSWKLYHPDGTPMPHHHCPMASALKEGRAVRGGEAIAERPDGTRIWFEPRPTPLRNSDGDVVGGINMLIDITERKRAEEALRNTQQELNDFVENGSIAMHWVGPDGIILWANRHELEMLGFTRDEYVGHHIADFHVDPPVIQDILQRLTCGHTLHEYPARLRCKDGSMRDVLINSNVRWQGDNFIHTRCFTRDITAQKEAEQARLKSEERFRALTNATSDVVYCMNRDWTEMRYLHGRDLVADTLEPSHTWLEKYVYPDDQPPLVAAIRRAIETKSTFELEHRVIRVNGAIGWTYSRAIPVLDAQGEIIEWFGAATDITKRKQAEAALRENEERFRNMAEALKESDRRKDEFLATLAHELRNPLAPIRNGLQIMQLAGDQPEKIEQMRAMMERQLGQMVRMIDDLLDLSRISRGKVELRKERVQLATVLQHAIEVARPAINEAGHELVIDAPSEAIFVHADATRLTQVFANLLNNAAKFTERGGRIELAVQRDGSHAVVRVCDNGIGIPADALPRIFDMFSQVDQSLERTRGGLGIGLSLVRGLVEMHGGSVAAHSEGHANGSEFTVRLPVALSVVGDSAPVAAPIRNVLRRRILVVDDNADAATTLALMLDLMGNDAQSAHSAQAALELAETFRPDAIVLDIGMPKLNGYEAARRIRERPWGKNIILVALTGWGQEKDRQLAGEAGFDAHLVKPAAPAEIEKLLQSLKSAIA